MKNILTFLAIISFTTAFAQTDTKVPFSKVTHSFGKIKQQTPVTTEFTFTNKTGKALIVQDATAECGCTTPEFPKTPVANGKTGTIKVTYNAENPGAFTKKVTVTFLNIKDPMILTIDGEVIEK